MGFVATWACAPWRDRSRRAGFVEDHAELRSPTCTPPGCGELGGSDPGWRPQSRASPRATNYQAYRPEEGKPEEGKPEEGRPGEARPEEGKPGAYRPEEGKPEEGRRVPASLGAIGHCWGRRGWSPALGAGNRPAVWARIMARSSRRIASTRVRSSSSAASLPSFISSS